jgi:NADPH:quinone reductase-like Zn-dependent oxidoreductase
MKVAEVPERSSTRFRLVEVATPRPGPGQILVRVEATGVNFSDIMRRRGDTYPVATTFPFVPGGEVAGTVVAHGEGVTSPAIGARVFALAGETGNGGYAQFAISYAMTAVPIPDEMSSVVASTLMIAGCTASLMLSQAARLVEGESVLVPAATGGVGSFAVQIARRMGGKVIALVGHERKTGRARELGAEVVIVEGPAWVEEVRRATKGVGVDVALEATGGAFLEATFGALAPFGRLVVYGAASGVGSTLSPAALIRLLHSPATNQSLTGFGVGHYFFQRPQVAGPALAALVRDVNEGRLLAPPVAVLPLERADEAHRLLETRNVIGKLALDPWKDN